MLLGSLNMAEFQNGSNSVGNPPSFCSFPVLALLCSASLPSPTGSAWVSILWVPGRGVAPSCVSLQGELGEMIHVQVSSGLFIGNTSILSPGLINFLTEVVSSLWVVLGERPSRMF